ncbi:MAG: SDR family NAD(P)-dependent oxidoreductase [Saprospirales bacterium]|nr:SDR family NAD(P)-dependent oxidoreductase [Saprospirales bacterium]
MRGKKFTLPDELDFIRAGRLPQKYSQESMDGKICVITGTTSGVGYQAAIRLAKAGARIVMIVRNRDMAERLCNELGPFLTMSPIIILPISHTWNRFAGRLRPFWQSIPGLMCLSIMPGFI